MINNLKAIPSSSTQNVSNISSSNATSSAQQNIPIGHSNSAPAYSPRIENNTTLLSQTPIQSTQNDSLELNQEALQNYLQCIRQSFPALSSLQAVAHPIYYQFVSVK